MEAWILADRVGFAKLLGIKVVHVPSNPDTLADPKASLISLVAKSKKKALRDAIIPTSASKAKQGIDYNTPLINFVLNAWNLQVAEQNSPSLRKAMQRIRTFRFTPPKASS